MAADLVLVTGGAGFIGSHLCESLIGRGYRVRVLDDLSVGLRENIPDRCEFLHGSVLDQRIVEEATSGVRHVCHEAARVTIRGSIEHFYEDAEVNLMGTLNLLRAGAKNGVKRFVYASSMAVYADSEKPEPVAENYPVMPASPYGIAKLAAERYVLMMGKEMKMEPVVLRYFNTFGTRQTYTPYVGVITIFITRLLARKPITIFGDGRQVRDFVHVSDIAQANILALEHQAAPGNIFNAGSGKGTSVLQLAELLKERLYPNAEVSFEAARPEELRNSIADIRSITERLGYKPTTNLLTQIDAVIDSLREKT